MPQQLSQDSFPLGRNVMYCLFKSAVLTLFAQNRKPFIWFFLPTWIGLQCAVGSGLAFGLTEACPYIWTQYAWGSSPWPRPSIRLSSFAKLQGTTHYRVILLIGPLSSPPHSCRVPPYSVRMEYACKPPPWNCCTRALPHSPMWKLRLGNIVLSS